ncbi:MAG: 4Fe-4S dicluster domain-containing protein [Deltaproteobacteria bacterium]|nr:4Fe-4S dicluster domain-containing protein [Deltaproteobacteria bacterium]MBW2136285.1 4Fe-4S dicluster domain-containing protein [Deltaproteobacteria bacterium]
MPKVLIVDPSLCTGCRTCELICSIKNEGVANPTLARIRVIADKYQGVRVPMICQQCRDAPCMCVCPSGALFRDETLDIVRRNEDRCIVCRSCVTACPFGAMGVDPVGKKVFKCELCEGDPECVRFCEDKALRYEEPDVLVMKKKREAFGSLSALFEKYASREGIVHMAT